MTKRYREVRTNAEILTLEQAELVDGSAATLSAPPLPGYRFLFWNVRARRHTTAVLPIPDVGEADFDATAWYLPTGGGPGQPGEPGIEAWAFSPVADAFVTATPIASVEPAAAWTADRRRASTASQGVEIAPKAEMEFTYRSPYAGAGDELVTAPLPFSGWDVYGAPEVERGSSLKFDRGASAFVVANFSLRPITKPDLDPHETWSLMEKIITRHLADVERLRARVRVAPRIAAARDDALAIHLERLDASTLRAAHADLVRKAQRLESARRLLESAIKSEK